MTPLKKYYARCHCIGDVLPLGQITGHKYLTWLFLGWPPSVDFESAHSWVHIFIYWLAFAWLSGTRRQICGNRKVQELQAMEYRHTVPKKIITFFVLFLWTLCLWRLFWNYFFFISIFYFTQYLYNKTNFK